MELSTEVSEVLGMVGGCLVYEPRLGEFSAIQHTSIPNAQCGLMLPDMYITGLFQNYQPLSGEYYVDSIVN